MSFAESHMPKSTVSTLYTNVNRWQTNLSSRACLVLLSIDLALQNCVVGVNNMPYKATTITLGDWAFGLCKFHVFITLWLLEKGIGGSGSRSLFLGINLWKNILYQMILCHLYQNLISKIYMCKNNYPLIHVIYFLIRQLFFCWHVLQLLNLSTVDMVSFDTKHLLQFGS